MKDYYQKEVNQIVSKQKQFSDCFCFAVVADTHLDNSMGDTLENLHAVSEHVRVDGLMHLGDFLNGSFPRDYTNLILNEQMSLFQNCISPFYPVQGNHDGFSDLTKPFSPNMALDEDWYAAISYLEQNPAAHLQKNKPYYYVDVPEKKIRMVFLCTFFYQYDGENYEKFYGTDLLQIEWVEHTALTVGEDWTVLLFSHDAPFEYFDERACTNNPRDNGNLLMNAVKNAQTAYQFTLAAWFVGHFHGDYIGRVNGLNFILVASETAYVPQLWDMPEGGYYPERALGTVTEDLWDLVCLDQKKRKITMLRFGAGSDRSMEY